MVSRRRAEPSQRQLRVGELIRHALADIFARGEVDDPALADGGVTVLEVTMSPDLKLATAYVMPFAGHRRDEIMQVLERNRRRIRGELGRRVDLKFMPDVRFRLDTSLDYARRIDEILHQPEVARDLGHEEDE